jgi:hypothetical protein
MGSPHSAGQPLYDFCVLSPSEQEPTLGVVYVNWVRSRSSPYDLTVDLGYTADDGPPAQFPVRAVMSWEHAKFLRALLDDAVTNYEEAVGPIRDLGIEIGPARPVPVPGGPALPSPDEEVQQ